MQREIKFRTWDKERKAMVDVESIDWSTQRIYFRSKEKDGLDGTPKTEMQNFYNIILIQYTGLKDKNGIEIYEGDIVKFDEEKPEIVGFSDGAFGTNRYDDRKLTGLFHWYNFCKIDHTSYIPEVVGNVFQNKELLKSR